MRVFTAIALVLILMACDTDKISSTAPRVARASASISPDREKPHLLDNVHLSRAERNAIFGINQRYNQEVNDLRKQSANPNGPVDPATVAKIRSIRQKQLAEWKGAMSPANAAVFEANRRSSVNWWMEMRGKFQSLRR
jgi:hypothetical protein